MSVLPWMTRQAAFHRCEWRCFYCGQTAVIDTNFKRAIGLTVDHVVPTSRGGADVPRNLVACCHTCNTIKAAGMPSAETRERAATLWCEWVAKGMPVATRELPVVDSPDGLVVDDPPYEEKVRRVAASLEVRS